MDDQVNAMWRAAFAQADTYNKGLHDGFQMGIEFARKLESKPVEHTDHERRPHEGELQAR